MRQPLPDPGERSDGGARRGDVFSDLAVEILRFAQDDVVVVHEEGFETAFGGFFEVLEKARLPESERVLYLLRRRG